MKSGVIWEKIREGDEKVFEMLYKDLFAPLCYVAIKIINDRHSAEEIVQDVFSKIWFNREIIEVHTSLNSYLFRSVKNSCINELKRRQTDKASIIRTTSYEIWKVLLDTCESNDFIIEQLISNDTQNAVSKAIEALPDQCKQVFVLSRIHNKSNDEIASLLNLSKNTVKSHLMNALKRVSAVIRKEK
ncbi:MAG TPA: RNA polymerase sigma-70 factor [Bacteroidales bacterium]|jgi:RNA polymerase sigma-70 factor (ECF subfamily)|nr:RNA polymerase sigma-70 factor [Bacteroidales bacterium]